MKKPEEYKYITSDFPDVANKLGLKKRIHIKSMYNISKVENGKDKILDSRNGANMS